MKIVVANGPNLNLLGTREPEVYGTTALADIESALRARAGDLGCEIVFFQSNHEGELLDRLQAEAPGAHGLIINPGAFSHSSYALYDCLRWMPVPIVEVHISNVYRRAEGFRTHMVTAPASTGVISGLGARGYLLALEYLVDRDQ